MKFICPIKKLSHLNKRIRCIVCGSYKHTKVTCVLSGSLQEEIVDSKPFKVIYLKTYKSCVQNNWEKDIDLFNVNDLFWKRYKYNKNTKKFRKVYNS